MTRLTDRLESILESKEDRMVEIRRYLHAHPELSYEEYETARYIANFYKELDCDIQTDIGGTGVVVTIDTKKSGRTIALRADFDALAVTEENDSPYKSKNTGVMHACGHDAHTAYMLILAESLIEIKEELEGKIVILHQPAEEIPPGGAIEMMKDGALEGVDNIIGAHVMSTMPTGEIYYIEGEAMTGRSNFTIDIRGEGGHASSPHQTKDAIIAGTAFVQEAQTIVSRSIDPYQMASLTISTFEAGGIVNGVNGSARLKGDVRTLSEEIRLKIEEEVRKRLDAINLMYGVEYDLEYVHNVPVLRNDVNFTRNVVNAIKEVNIKEIKAVKEIDPVQPSEDFANFSQKRPSTYLFIGAQPETGEVYPHHHPKFRINEKALLVAAKAVGIATIEYLSHEEGEKI